MRFRREYLSEFVDDVAAFLPQHLIDAAVKPGRYELPYREGFRYVMAVDPSGGGPDHFACSVVHAEGTGADLRVVQDVLKGWATRGADTVDLEGIVAEIAEIAKRYRLDTVYGDRYSREWVAQAFRRRGLRYESDQQPPLDKSAAYLETEPLFTQGRIEVLDHPVQRRELVCLERRPRPGNRATVDHPTSAGAHDDYANVLALAAAVVSRERRRMLEGYRGVPEGPPDDGSPQECSGCGLRHPRDARCPHAAPSPTELRRLGLTYI